MVVKRYQKEQKKNSEKIWAYNPTIFIKTKIMKEIKIIIEKGKDGYGAYAENVEGITGFGITVKECKQDVDDCIETIKTFDVENIPNWARKPYTITYKFDIPGILEYYKGIFTNAALERITGINQRQIQHYASGEKKPRPAQSKKIETALHNLGEELLAVEL